MKKQFILFFCLFVSVVCLSAKDTEKTEITVKANARGGQILYSDKPSKIIAPGPSWGGEIDVEFPSTRQYAWQQYFGDPTIGVGLVYMNLGAEVLGNCVAVYPYFLLHMIDLPHFQFNWKAGFGISLFDKYYWFNTINAITTAIIGTASTNATPMNIVV